MRNTLAISLSFLQIWKMSPLSRSETKLLYNTVYDKVVKTFVMHIINGCLAFVLTYCALSVGEFEIKWVFAFLSAFFSFVPVVSAWAIWLPSLIVAIARDGIFSSSWIMMTCCYLLYIACETIVWYASRIESQNPFMISSSIFMGIYTFGFYGLLVGPSVAGVSLVLLDIYQLYISDNDTKDMHARSRSNDHLE